MWKVENRLRKTKESTCTHSLQYKLYKKLFYHSCKFSPVIFYMLSYYPTAQSRVQVKHE